MTKDTHIYLDYAAATPMDSAVLEAMKPYFATQFYNPSALYLAAKDVAVDVEAARSRAAYWLGSKPSEVFFAAGGTEANNLAIRGVMSQYPGANVIVSAVEHESVLAPAREYVCREAPVGPDGSLDLNKLEQCIDSQTVLVSVMYANNEIGTIQPISAVSKLIAAVRRRREREGNVLPLYLHTDACQAAAYLDLHATRLGVDLMTINGGKIYGPKQSAVLYTRAGVTLAPQIVGGGQERGLRSGTENVAGVIGLACALDLVQERRKSEAARLQELQKLFMANLERAPINARVNGSRSRRLPNNVHVTLPGHDNERIVMLLDKAGIQCAAGSACSASSDEPSHTLKAIGLSDADAQSSVRFTMGRATTESDVKTVAKQLAAVL